MLSRFKKRDIAADMREDVGRKIEVADLLDAKVITSIVDYAVVKWEKEAKKGNNTLDEKISRFDKIYNERKSSLLKCISRCMGLLKSVIRGNEKI